VFDAIAEQLEAKRLLEAALVDDPAHAYLFHGPAGVGKRRLALAFAARLLTDDGRVERRAHPDLYVLEPLGDQIRIDAVREMRRDLHMRPFEADRRVYLVFSAQLLNDEAADALLKDLEEPPPYAVIVLVADDLGPLSETIRSRCQLVPFRRLSERAIREAIEAEEPMLSPAEVTALARVAAGRLDRVAQLLDPGGAARRTALLEVARGVYADPSFDPGAAAARVLELAAEQARKVRDRLEGELEDVDLPDREREQRLKRAQFGAEREQVLEAFEELAAWYRDLVVVAAGAEGAVIHFDHLAELTEDASVERLAAAERAAELVRDSWRTFEEFNVNSSLALESLFVRLRRELAGAESLV
jgi:DNA polymerase III subunit delta'